MFGLIDQPQHPLEAYSPENSHELRRLSSSLESSLVAMECSIPSTMQNVTGLPDPRLLLHWMVMDDGKAADLRKREIQERASLVQKVLLKDLVSRGSLHVTEECKYSFGSALAVDVGEDKPICFFESSCIRLRGGGSGSGRDSINCSLILRAPYGPRRARGGGCGNKNGGQRPQRPPGPPSCPPPPPPPSCCPPPPSCCPPPPPMVAFPVALPVPVPVAIPVPMRKSGAKKQDCQQSGGDSESADRINKLCKAAECIINELKSVCSQDGGQKSQSEDGSYSAKEVAQLASMAALATNEAKACSKIVKVVDPNNPCTPPLTFKVTKVDKEEPKSQCCPQPKTNQCGSKPKANQCCPQQKDSQSCPKSQKNTCEKPDTEAAVIIIAPNDLKNLKTGTQLSPVGGSSNVFMVTSGCGE